MIFHQLFDQRSHTFTYLLADKCGGEAAIIDPVREHVEHYLRLIRSLDVRLVKALDTHVHADHVTALGALRTRTQCVTIMGQQSRAACVSETVRDGDVVRVGLLKLEAIYTPGHTDDSYSFRLPDRVFTGDTLLIRGTGRTDFQNGDPGMQYDSIFNRLLTLPEHTAVYPAHDYHGRTSSTLGEEKRFNPRLQVGSKSDYIRLMNQLKLPSPELMDVAIPANRSCGEL